jgi:hypothetical protein
MLWANALRATFSVQTKESIRSGLQPSYGHNIAWPCKRAHLKYASAPSFVRQLAAATQHVFVRMEDDGECQDMSASFQNRFRVQ